LAQPDLALGAATLPHRPVESWRCSARAVRCPQGRDNFRERGSHIPHLVSCPAEDPSTHSVFQPWILIVRRPLQKTLRMLWRRRPFSRAPPSLPKISTFGT